MYNLSIPGSPWRLKAQTRSFGCDCEIFCFFLFNAIPGEKIGFPASVSRSAEGDRWQGYHNGIKRLSNDHMSDVYDNNWAKPMYQQVYRRSEVR